MRAILDEVGSSAGGSYNPQRSDFPAASAGVLVWMANKMIAQNSLDDAVAAMERLVELWGYRRRVFIRCTLFDWSSQGEGKRLSVCIR